MLMTHNTNVLIVTLITRGTKTLIKLLSISLHIKVQKIRKELNKFMARLCFNYVQIVEIDQH